MKTKNRIAAAMLAVMVVLGVSTTVWAASGTRLRASQNKRINGFEAELRGDYREDRGVPNRLNAELEKINLPLGTKVAFCLVQNGATSLIGVAQVRTIAGIQTAKVELETNDGDVVPNVNAGNVLQARQRTAAPFQANPSCTTNLLISAPFAQ